MAQKVYKSSIPEINLDFKQSFKTEGSRWFRIVQKLGHGGNGITYLVLGTEGEVNGHFYAMKMFKRLDSFSRKKKFLKEIKFLKLNDHPSIMRLADTGGYAIDWAGSKFQFPFYMADFLPRTLSDVIRERTASTVEKSSYVVQLLSALDHISSLASPVIHRDIKPQNIFVKGKTCLLGDFGLMTRDTPDQKNDRGVMSESKKPAVPYFYRTPDIVSFEKTGERLTPASDIFQMGLVACHLFTGRNPLIASHNILETIKLEPIGEIGGSLGSSISALIKRMLQIEPSYRPTAKELLDPWREVFWSAAQMSRKLNGYVM
jgi:eukaryotic-like serine/threonine-protein kinase